MRLLIDNVNLEKIKMIYKYFPVDGVTCNPSILKAEGHPPYEQLKKIREFIGPNAELHVQVISKVAETMVEEGEKIISAFGEDTYIKIPVNKEGLKAIHQLSQKGYNVTGTAIYSQMQGFLAAKSGAKVVAPYINRLDDLGYDGIKIAQDIDAMIKNANLDCGIIGASLKSSKQIIELYKYGVAGLTLSADMFDKLIDNEIVNSVVTKFIEDFEEINGEGMTMLTSK